MAAFTVRIDDKIYRQFKARCVEQGQTLQTRILTCIINDLMQPCAPLSGDAIVLAQERSRVLQGKNPRGPVYESELQNWKLIDDQPAPPTLEH